MMLWNSQVPSFLQCRPAEVGEKHLDASNVAYAEHWPCRHLDFEQNALRPAHDVVVAFPAREAAMQSVVLPPTVKVGVTLSDLLKGWLVGAEVDPPRAAPC